MPIKVAVATKHGKLAQIAPAFDRLKQWQLELASIDTDEFGTFSGEVERTLSPRETVIEKAKAGARSLGLDYGIASEGTIGAHPHLPFVNSDYELMAFVCLSKGVAIVESFLSADITAYSKVVSDSSDLDVISDALDLPNHAANIIVETKSGRQIHKGITDVLEVQRIVEQHLRDGANDVRLESDFRAMNSPSRQANIASCAQRLAQRIASNCPECSHYGWGRIGYEYGLPCQSCGLMNEGVANAEKLGCPSCDFVEVSELALKAVEPSRCEYCNP